MKQRTFVGDGNHLELDIQWRHQSLLILWDGMALTNGPPCLRTWERESIKKKKIGSRCKGMSPGLMWVSNCCKHDWGQSSGLLISHLLSGTDKSLGTLSYTLPGLLRHFLPQRHHFFVQVWNWGKGRKEERCPVCNLAKTSCWGITERFFFFFK